LALPGGHPTGLPHPLLDCWSVGGTTTTLVLGCSKTRSTAATYDVGGSSDHWTPARYDGPQPDTPEVGTSHGAFRVVMASADVPTATWTLGSTTLAVGDAKAATASSTTSTPLPAGGNGTGVAVALLAAGGIGALLVRRARRRVTA
jgi:hypothetical protein